MMVNLVSGGLDSTLVGILAKEQKIKTFPLFIDYGQRAVKKEWEVCRLVHKKYRLGNPEILKIPGFGKLIRTGLTDKSQDIKIDAFTPCRNLMFLVLAASYAHQNNASSISMGLLSEAFSLFPDQRSGFIQASEKAIYEALGYSIKVLTPLSDFSKQDVVKLASEYKLKNTYSCHKGSLKPCGHCISCSEFLN